MALELIGAIALGFMAAGLALLALRLSRGRLPRALVPISAGLAMLGFGLWSDYSWAERTQAALPDHFAVLGSHAERSPMRPWTYLFPVTDRFSAIDREAVGRNPDHPDIALVDVVLVTRRMPVGRVAQFVDCRTGKRAQVVDAASLDPASANLRWIELPAGDPLLTASCGTA